uniref:ATP synthase F0 subunit 8 n=1 Tax=Nandigallia matai TaxID=1792639 RepID=UPI00300166C0|nr:ATP synthase F0 subunit 8 [Nandigallia matai]
MPQMSPMWWTSIFILLNCLIMILMTMMYFIKETNFKKKITLINKSMKWKW